MMASESDLSSWSSSLSSWQEKARRRAKIYTQLVRVHGGVITRAILRRWLVGPKRPGWPLQMELIVDIVHQGALQTMPTLRQIRRAPATNLVPGASLLHVTVNGVKGDWTTHESAVRSNRVVLYLHGGGYCFCSTNTHRNLTSRVSRACQARVLSLDYRLAPEHPFPAALEDAVAAYRWLISADGGKCSPGDIVIAGDSAGGGLTVATLLYLRDNNMPLPAAAIPISPWVDVRCSSDSWERNQKYDYLVVPTPKLPFNIYYAGSESNMTNPYVSPIFGDLVGLPPLLIQAGEVELLIDDCTAFAKKAKEAGLDVTFQVYDNMVHVFQGFGSMVPQTKESMTNMRKFVDLHVPLTTLASAPPFGDIRVPRSQATSPKL